MGAIPISSQKHSSQGQGHTELVKDTDSMLPGEGKLSTNPAAYADLGKTTHAVRRRGSLPECACDRGREELPAKMALVKDEETKTLRGSGWHSTSSALIG